MAMAESVAGGHGLDEDGGGNTPMAMAESEAVRRGCGLDEDRGANEASETASREMYQVLNTALSSIRL